MHTHTTLSRASRKACLVASRISFHSPFSVLFRSLLDELVYQPLANALYFSPTSCQVVLQSLRAKGNGPMYALLLTVTDAVRGKIWQDLALGSAMRLCSRSRPVPLLKIHIA